MRTQHYLSFALASLAFAAALALPAFAQDDTGDMSAAATDAATAAEETVVAQIEDAGLSTEALQDEIVTEEDLGAKTPGAFHFLKRFFDLPSQAFASEEYFRIPASRGSYA